MRIEYTRRVKLLLKSKLNVGNVIKAINTWAVAVQRYPEEILDRTQDELKFIDRKTLKLMTVDRALHPRANVARLYLLRNEGRRVLKSAEETVRTDKSMDCLITSGVKIKEVIDC